MPVRLVLIIAVKVGLFNSAFNEHWKVFWHFTCVEQAKTDKQLSVCNARLSIGVLLIFSLISVFLAASLLSVMASKMLSEARIAQAKLAVMGLFGFSGTILIYNSFNQHNFLLSWKWCNVQNN